MVCCTAGARCSTRCRTLSATTRFSPCWCATRAEDALVTEVFINLNFKFRRSNHSGGTQKVIVGDGAARKVFPQGKPAGLAGRHGHDYFCRADRDREDEEKHPKNLYSAFLLVRIEIKFNYFGLEDIFVFGLQKLNLSLDQRIERRVVIDNGSRSEIVPLFHLPGGFLGRGDVFLRREILVPRRPGIDQCLRSLLVHLLLRGA